ncbi:MAG: glycosyltransferase family 9 protein [Alphaproteobacteria bacterium]
MTASRSRILIIKHGALGDVVMALGPMAAIRAHHADARITVLTTAPYAAFLGQSPLADEVWVDEHPPAWRFDRVIALARRLRGGRFDRVYDLQTSDRSSLYFRLLGTPKPEWSGIARGCSHPHADPARDRMHTLDRQRAQLGLAGIVEVPDANLGWATADFGGFGLPERYALLAPGGAAHRPAKRWPAERFGALALRLAHRGMAPVLVGAERDALAATHAACPAAIDLGGATSLIELAALARGAVLAVGNDSGPMHLAAVVGCPTLVLFSGASDPDLTAPRGPRVAVLRAGRLAELDVDAVLAALPARA